MAKGRSCSDGLEAAVLKSTAIQNQALSMVTSIGLAILTKL